MEWNKLFFKLFAAHLKIFYILLELLVVRDKDYDAQFVGL